MDLDRSTQNRLATGELELVVCGGIIELADPRFTAPRGRSPRGAVVHQLRLPTTAGPGGRELILANADREFHKHPELERVCSREAWLREALRKAGLPAELDTPEADRAGENREARRTLIAKACSELKNAGPLVAGICSERAWVEDALRQGGYSPDLDKAEVERIGGWEAPGRQHCGRITGSFS